MVLTILFSSCAIGELISIVNENKTLQVPKWDFEFKAPLIEKKYNFGITFR